jgi:hypothetical protein
MSLLRGLPGVDVRIVADPTLRQSAAAEESTVAAGGLAGGHGEGVDGDASPRTA